MRIVRTLIALFGSLVGLLLLTPAILIALPFWLVAFLTSLTARFLEPSYMSWHDLLTYEPIIGWRPRPNLNAHYVLNSDDIFRVVTDDQGWPGSKSIAESEVVVFGDSFAFGYGANAGSSFADLNSKLRVKAVAANGYNMVQEALWMQRLAPQLTGKLVIWLIFIGNDLMENLRPNLQHYRMPFVRTDQETGNWEVVTSHISSKRWPFHGERDYRKELADICSPTFFSDRVYSACEFLVQLGKNTCGEAGARLAVMTAPSRYQLSRDSLEIMSSHRADVDPSLPDKRISKICSKLNVPFVAAMDVLTERDYKRYDAHWNQRGHQKVADLVTELYHECVLEDKYSSGTRLVMN